MTSNEIYKTLDSVFTELLTKYQERILNKSNQYTPDYGKITTGYFDEYVEKENRYIIRTDVICKTMYAIDNYGDYLYKPRESNVDNDVIYNKITSNLVKNKLPDVFIDFLKKVFIGDTHMYTPSILIDIKPLVDNYYNNFNQMTFIKSKLNEYKYLETLENSLLDKVLRIEEEIEEQKEYIDILQNQIKIMEQYNSSHLSYYYNKIKSYFT